MLKELSNNLNMLMAKSRITSNELARQINIPATTIKRIRNNEQANPTITTLLPIAQYFEISLDQLIGNEGLAPSSDFQYQRKTTNKAPLLSWEECIHYCSDNISESSKTIYVEKSLSSKAFGLINNHDLDLFPKNSILIIEPTYQPLTGDYVIAANMKQNSISIRKYIVEIDKVYLKPLIKEVDICALTPEIQILGVIIEYKLELVRNI